MSTRQRLVQIPMAMLYGLQIMLKTTVWNFQEIGLARPYLTGPNRSQGGGRGGGNGVQNKNNDTNSD